MIRSLLPLLILVALALLAPLLAAHDPMATSAASQLQPPSLAHPFGTDLFGRDVLSRLAHGGQHTLAIAALASLIALLPGGAIGLMLSVAPKWIDDLAALIIDAVLAFPALIVALIIMTLLGQGAPALAVATGIAQLASVARVVRGAGLETHSSGYVEAARSLGAPAGQIMTRHILPNIVPVVLAYSGVTFSYSLLNSAALSFLGLGGEPGIPDWGVMLAEGREAFRAAPWVAFAPGLAVTLAVMIVNRTAERLARRPRR